jgi:hypothetical protein
MTLIVNKRSELKDIYNTYIASSFKLYKDNSKTWIGLSKNRKNEAQMILFKDY